MDKTIKAAVLHGIGDVRIDRVPMPEITQDNEVLVKMQAVGVCGSDVHYYKHGRIGDYVVETPMILGHESAGVVEAVGSAVQHVKPGDNVALEPGIPCGVCAYCRTGRYNLCADVRFMATPPIDGAFVEYVVHPAAFTYKLPDGMTCSEGAMMEPLAVGMHACELADVQAGDTVAVLGSGPIGLLAMEAAKARGATGIIAVDVVDFRLDLAKQLGADRIINAREVDTVTAIREITEGLGVKVVFETAGTATTAQQSVEVVKKGGTIVLIGLGVQTAIPMNTTRLIVNEIKVLGVHRYANIYDRAIALVAQGTIDVASLITGEFSLDDVEEGLNASEKEPTKTVKSMIRF